MLELARRFEDTGVACIIYTDIDRDGVLEGVNVASTAALANAVRIPIIASGGVAGIDDIRRLKQSDAAQMACRVFSGRFASYERMAPVFETAGIRTRHTVEPPEWYLSGKLGWRERMAAYLAGAERLFLEIGRAHV